MGFIDKYREKLNEGDHRSLQTEFGITRENAIELHIRVARAMWLGIKIGSFVTLGIILMVLGGWALCRFFAR